MICGKSDTKDNANDATPLALDTHGQTLSLQDMLRLSIGSFFVLFLL